MLSHHELLPEEQSNLDLIQQLRATYQMTPEEKQVLTRVHERLARSSEPLPLLESVSAGRATRPLQLTPPIATPYWIARSRQRWLRPLNTLIAVLFIALLVGSLVLTFSIMGRSRIGSSPAAGTIRVLLVPAKSGFIPSQATMEATRTALVQRFMSFGLNEVSVQVLTANGRPAILLKIPHFGGNERQTIDILTEKGTLECWNTGPDGLITPGTPFDHNQYFQYNPGGKPPFTGKDFDLNAFSLLADPHTGEPAINAEMKSYAIPAFQQFTAQHIGDALTIILDNKVLMSARIESSIDGPFEVVGNFTQQQASAFVSMLRNGPLPIELKQLS